MVSTLYIDSMGILWIGYENSGLASYNPESGEYQEEFLIPRHLTEGVKRLAIKIEYVPDDRELFPGHPFPTESAWSESRYCVITSYSIHYTKLYEPTSIGSDP